MNALTTSTNDDLIKWLNKRIKTLKKKHQNSDRYEAKINFGAKIKMSYDVIEYINQNNKKLNNHDKEKTFETSEHTNNQ